LNLDDALREVQFFVVELESHLYRAQRAANQLWQSSMNRKDSQIRDLFHILIEETRTASQMQNHSNTELNGIPLQKHQFNYISKVEKNTDEAFLNLFESIFSIIRCSNSEICWKTHGIAILSLATTYSEVTMRRDPKYWVQAPFSMLWPKGRTGKLVPSIPTLTLIYLQQHLPTTDKRPLQLYEALLTQMETNLIPAQPVFDLFNELSMWIKVVVDNYWANELMQSKNRCCEKACLGGRSFDWESHLSEQYFDAITTLEVFTVSAAALRWVTLSNTNQSSVFDQIKVRVRGRLFRKDFSLVTWRTYVLHQKSYSQAVNEYDRLSHLKTSGEEISEKEVVALIEALTNLCSVLQAVGMECSVLARLGMIYWKLLDDEEKARGYFTQALEKIDDPRYEQYQKCESVVETRHNLCVLNRAYEKAKKRQAEEEIKRRTEEERRLREEILRKEEDKRRQQEEIRKFREAEEEQRRTEQEKRQREEEEARKKEQEEKQLQEEKRARLEMQEENERKLKEEEERQRDAERLLKRAQEQKRRQMEEAIKRFEKEMEDKKRFEKEQQKRQQEERRRAAEAENRRRWEAEEQRRKAQEKAQKEAFQRSQREAEEQRTKDYEERRRKREQNSSRRSSGAEKLFRQADQRRRDTSYNLSTLTLKAREIYGMTSLMGLLRWLYETFTPIDPVSGVRLQSLVRGEHVSANDFRSVIFIYHPDKNCRHGELWKYLCQEVTKVDSFEG
jgi:hypothetical protein